MTAVRARRVCVWWIAFSLGGVAVLLSCAPEIGPPTWPVVVAHYSYATPREALRSIATALAAGPQGAPHYLAAFVDSTEPGTPGYHHLFDPADVAVFEGDCQCQAPADWGRAQEQSFYAAFVNVRPSDRYTAVFDSVDFYPDPPPSGTRADLYRAYRVLSTSPDGNTTISIAVGMASLTFEKVAGDRWVITYWRDHVDPTVGVNPVDPDQLTLGRRRLDSTR